MQGPHWRGNGSAYSTQYRPTHYLRYVQSRGSRHDDHRREAFRKARRQVGALGGREVGLSPNCGLTATCKNWLKARSDPLLPFRSNAQLSWTCTMMASTSLPIHGCPQGRSSSRQSTCRRRSCPPVWCCSFARA